MDLLKHHRKIASLLLFVFLLQQWGCVRWHRHPLNSDSLPPVLEKGRTVFLVSPSPEGEKVWLIEHPMLTRDSIFGRFVRYADDRASRLLLADRNFEYKQQRNRVLLHASSNSGFNASDSTRQAVAMSGIEYIESIDVDAGATIALSAVAVAGFFGALFLIILLTKSSCPFIYTEDADGFHFEGEVFSGSIYPQLQRHDRLPLHHLTPVNGEYHVRVANKALEIQSTDLLELLVVDHDPGTDVLFDRAGHPLAFNAPIAPIAARDLKGDNVLDILSKADDIAWVGDAKNMRPDADEAVDLTFVKPVGATSAKLMVRAKNTFWADHLYGLFLDEFGTYTDRVQAMNRNKSADELRQWSSDQKLPLGILIEKRPGEWERIGQFELAGPMAWREDAVRIDLTAVQGDRVHVRLETGFMFWEVDQVAWDTTAEQAMEVRTLTATSAIDQVGHDVLGTLLQEDGSFLVQPAVDDRTDVVFNAPAPTPGMERSLFLHAAGHYEILRTPKTHTPNVLYLRSFNEPGAFPRYSRERWYDTQELEFERPL